MKCSTVGRQWQWISHALRLFYYPSLHTVEHAAFLSWHICWDEEVIAVSTLRLPWRQRGFHSHARFPGDPVFACHRGTGALKELSALHSGFYLNHWRLAAVFFFEKELCVSWPSALHAASKELCKGSKDIWSVLFSWVCLCVFTLSGRRNEVRQLLTVLPFFPQANTSKCMKMKLRTNVLNEKSSLLWLVIPTTLQKHKFKDNFLFTVNPSLLITSAVCIALTDTLTSWVIFNTWAFLMLHFMTSGLLAHLWIKIVLF